MAILLLLALEFSFIFVVVPLLIYRRLLPNFPIPYLLIAALLAYLLLKQDQAFPINSLGSWQGFRSHLWPILARDAVCLLLLAIATWIFAPQLLFSLIKRNPVLWLLVFFLYPLISVYPQEILFRTFFFYRYAPLFGHGWGLLAASALAFGFVHIIFRNWIAVLLCTIGGLLFSLTYLSSGSLLLTCLDHAIFGNFLFTIGLGQFFYHRSPTGPWSFPNFSPKSPVSR